MATIDGAFRGQPFTIGDDVGSGTRRIRPNLDLTHERKQGNLCCTILAGIVSALAIAAFFALCIALCGAPIAMLVIGIVVLASGGSAALGGGLIGGAVALALINCCVGSSARQRQQEREAAKERYGQPQVPNHEQAQREFNADFNNMARGFFREADERAQQANQRPNDPPPPYDDRANNRQ